MCENCSTFTTSMTSFWCLYCKLWTNFTLRSHVSMVDFEQLNADWGAPKFSSFSTLFAFVITKWVIYCRKLDPKHFHTTLKHLKNELCQPLQSNLKTMHLHFSAILKMKMKGDKQIFVLTYLSHYTAQCRLSIPPENIRKPEGFLFSGGTDKQHRTVMG